MPMFEFLIALFGGLYYSGKYINEKSTHRKIDIQTKRRIDEMRSDFDGWFKCVVDDKLEYEIMSTPKDIFENMRQRIYKEANLQIVSDDMVVMGLLAQKAKIPKSIAQSGIPSRGIWDYSEKLMWAEQRKFLLWYDNELRKNGLSEPMLFVDGVNANEVRHNINLATPIAKGTQMIGGRYFWAPIRGYI